MAKKGRSEEGKRGRRINANYETVNGYFLDVVLGLKVLINFSFLRFLTLELIGVVKFPIDQDVLAF